MSSNVSLDTNVLLRWLLKDIPAQTTVAEKLLASGQTLEVADAAINEIAYVLEKSLGMSREMVAVNVGLILSIGTIQCNRALYTAVLPLYTAHPAVSFIDCCLAVYAKLNKAAPLLTFDQKLAKKLPNTKLL